MTSLSPQRFNWPWLRQRLFPRDARIISWAAYIIILAVMTVYILDPGDRTSWRFSLTVLTLAILLTLNILWDELESKFTPPERGTWMLLILSALLALSATWSGRLVNTIYLIFMLASQANLMLRLKPALLYSLVLSSAWMGVVALLGPESAALINVIVGLLIGLTFSTTLSQALNRYSEQTRRASALLRQLQEANAGLVAARQKEKDLAIAEERLRMARDLHDGLGHHLTALSVQLQVLEKIAPGDPARAAQVARNCQSEVQAALKEVRQSVAALRAAPLDLQALPETIARLVEQTGQHLGVAAHFDLRGQPVEISPVMTMTLFRTAQEGLTNIQKHARLPRQVCVELSFTSQQVSISVRDDGQVEPQEAAGLTGFGLAGLKERAHLLGGSLEYGPALQGGFALLLRLPLSVPEGDRQA